MSDPMFKLEHEKNDVEKMKMSLPTLQEIKDSADLMKEDFLLHRTLRKSFREEKKVFFYLKIIFINKFNL